MLLLEMLEWALGLAERLLLQERAFVGQVTAEVDCLLLPWTLAVGCNVFSTSSMLKVWSPSQQPQCHLEAYQKCSIPGPFQTH